MAKKTVLRLKKEFEGKEIRRQIPRMGETIFDTNKVDPSEFPHYAACGFEDCFENEVIELPKPEKVEKAPAVEVEEEDEDENDDEDGLELDLEKDEEGDEEGEEENPEAPAVEVEKEKPAPPAPAAEKPKNKGGRPPKKK